MASPYAPILTKRGKKLSLAKIATKPPKDFDRSAAEEKLAALEAELSTLQELMWGARENSVLLILQGRDTAGKDGTIKRVAGAFNPRGVHVTSFGVPTTEEAEHDFLWRIHRHTPRKGEVAIFNRSHYEDVLVARVHKLVKTRLWKARYDHINGFESLLVEHGCIVLKVFLHISKDEQRERLLEREADPTKAWKLDPNDWTERQRWSDYTHAYEDALSRCTSPTAPWHIVPADSKTYRNLRVAEALAAALRPHKEQWVRSLTEKGRLGQQALSTLHARVRK
jgi:PPK2 family polyphosphate:nucleotide phosphotransferase